MLENTSSLPEKIGKYDILSAIGKGSMGVIYKGKDPVIERLVAVKTIRFDSSLFRVDKETAINRLLLEAKAVGKLSHPNIVTVYDAGEYQGLYYIAMEYLEGTELHNILSTTSRPLSLKFSLDIATQMCKGLYYAHVNKIIHRDIKPGNIMILKSGTVKVMDFGIAILADSNLSLTHAGKTLGSPSYMSPEQIMGGRLDQRSDIFSAGVVFYEMLTHEKPFRGKNIGEVAFKITNNQPAPPSSINPKIPEELDEVILKALEKEVDKRFETCEDFRIALEGIKKSLNETSEIDDPYKKFQVFKKRRNIVKELSQRIYEASNKTLDIFSKLKKAVFISLIVTLLMSLISTPFMIGKIQDNIAKGKETRLLRSANDLYSQGKINDALENYKKVYENNPENKDALIGLAKSYNKQGDIQQSIESYKKLIEIDSLNLTHYNEIAELYRKKSDFNKAIDVYKKMIEINPDYHLSYFHLGVLNYIYIKPQNVKKAETYFTECIDRNPDFEDAYIFLSTIYADNYKQLTKAENLLENLLRRKPESAQALYRLGYIAVGRRQYKEAAEYFNKSLKFDPNLPQAHKSLGYLYEKRLKDNIKAIYHYQRYLDNITDEKEKEEVMKTIKKLEKS